MCAFLHESIVIQCLSVDELYKGQLAELPTILDSFYATITNDHIGMEVGGGGELRMWWVFLCVEADTARRSHLKPIQTLDITNSIQFDGQAFCPVVWRFPARWVPFQHTSTSDRLEKQAPGKADQGTIGNDTHMDC